jgi:hypothetical protein
MAEGNKRIENEEQIIAWLRDVLSSPEVKKDVSNLLAQALG